MSKKYSIQKGSALIFSFVVMLMMLMLALGVASVTLIERSSSGATSKSIQAFQASDSGAERIKEKLRYGSNTTGLPIHPGVTLNNASALGSACVNSGGVATYYECVESLNCQSDYGKRQYRAQLYRREYTGANAGSHVKLTCNDLVGKVSKVEVTGIFGEEQTAGGGTSSGSSRSISVPIDGCFMYNPIPMNTNGFDADTGTTNNTKRKSILWHLDNITSGNEADVYKMYKTTFTGGVSARFDERVCNRSLLFDGSGTVWARPNNTDGSYRYTPDEVKVEAWVKLDKSDITGAWDDTKIETIVSATQWFTSNNQVFSLGIRKNMDTGEPAFYATAAQAGSNPGILVTAESEDDLSDTGNATFFNQDAANDTKWIYLTITYRSKNSRTDEPGGFDVGNLILYVNGTRVAQSDPTTDLNRDLWEPSNNHRFVIGASVAPNQTATNTSAADAFSYTNHFKGYIDEVRISNETNAKHWFDDTNASARNESNVLLDIFSSMYPNPVD